MKKRIDWSANEEKYLLDHWGEIPMEELRRNLQNRTANSIVLKYNRIKGKKPIGTKERYKNKTKRASFVKPTPALAMAGVLDYSPILNNTLTVDDTGELVTKHTKRERWGHYMDEFIIKGTELNMCPTLMARVIGYPLSSIEDRIKKFKIDPELRGKRLAYAAERRHEFPDSWKQQADKYTIFPNTKKEKHPNQYQRMEKYPNVSARKPSFWSFFKKVLTGS